MIVDDWVTRWRRIFSQPEDELSGTEDTVVSPLSQKVSFGDGVSRLPNSRCPIVPNEQEQSNLTKMIYIASPYSHKSPQVRLARVQGVDKAIGQLQDSWPYAFIGPITQSHRTVWYMKSQGTGFESWELRDLTYISRCDEVWVLKLAGWKKSVGVTKEIEFALKKNIRVRYLTPKGLKFTGNK